MLRTRVITALILVGIIIAVLGWGGAMAWNGFVAVMIIVGLWEWSRFARLPSNQQYLFAAVVGTALIASGQFIHEPRFLVPLLVMSGIFWVTLAPYTLKRVGGAWLDNSWLQLAVAVVLLAATGASLVVARERGIMFLFSLFALVWIADIAAYFCGKAFGKKKLAPRISPGKSWAGAWGGIAGGVIYGWAWVFVAQAFPVLQGNWPEVLLGKWHPVMFTAWLVALSALSITGDLFESLLKRRVGFKDSSQLLPGHGGVLDRIDAQIPVLPIAILIVGTV